MNKVECISVFDMLKIGVGPSSSHTLGPWRASQRWIEELKDNGDFEAVDRIKIHLYGSLSLTGIGHATDIAAVLGLCGHDPVTMDTSTINDEIDFIKAKSEIHFDNKLFVEFDFDKDVVFHKDFLDFHPNGMIYEASLKNGQKIESAFYSIGGGFVVKEDRKNAKEKEADLAQFPNPISSAVELLEHCHNKQKSIADIVMENELSLRSKEEIDTSFKAIWDVMLESMYLGCHSEGTLPGGLNVTRRAPKMNKKLLGEHFNTYENKE
ncbi:MAG: serine dehydratase beta chain, partial [Bacteroidota bacterium]